MFPREKAGHLDDRDQKASLYQFTPRPSVSRCPRQDTEVRVKCNKHQEACIVWPGVMDMGKC